MPNLLESWQAFSDFRGDYRKNLRLQPRHIHNSPLGLLYSFQLSLWACCSTSCRPPRSGVQRVGRGRLDRNSFRHVSISSHVCISSRGNRSNSRTCLKHIPASIRWGLASHWYKESSQRFLSLAATHNHYLTPSFFVLRPISSMLLQFLLESS